MQLSGVPDGYFDKVVQLMVRAGFTLISRVVIDTNDCPYHVEASFARCTTLVFHMLGKSIVVRLAFNENDAFGRRYTAWAIDVDTVFLSDYEMVRRTYNPNSDPWEDEDKKYRKVPGYNCALKFEGFVRYSTHWGEFPEPAAPTEPERLVAVLREGLKDTLPYLGKDRIDELQVTDFPPHYTFPGSEPIFWKRFDTNYFRRVVRHPWGSCNV